MALFSFFSEVEAISGVLSGRLGMEGLETVEGSVSESSDDDSDEAPSTSGMSFRVPKTDSDAVEMAVEYPDSSPRARGLRSDSSSPTQLQARAPDSGSGVSEDSCAERGGTPAAVSEERNLATETEKAQERKEAESEEPTEKEAAEAELNKQKETKEMTDGEGAAKVAPGEDRGPVPAARLAASQPVSNFEGSLSKAKSV